MDEAFDIINDHPKPLSLYAFTSSKAFQERVINETSAGAVCINDTVLHVRRSVTLAFFFFFFNVGFFMFR